MLMTADCYGSLEFVDDGFYDGKTEAGPFGPGVFALGEKRFENTIKVCLGNTDAVVGNFYGRFS